METQTIDHIFHMLTALLRQSQQLIWIGGYVVGKKKNGDGTWIALYSPNTHLKMKVVTVYEEDYHKLPKFIDPKRKPSGREKPFKNEAREDGNYIECPLFQVVVYTRPSGDDKEQKVLQATIRETNVTAHYLSKLGDRIWFDHDSDHYASFEMRGQMQPEVIQATANSIASANFVANAKDNKGEGHPLPNYAEQACKANNLDEFVYYAFMHLNRGNIFTEQEHVVKIVNILNSMMNNQWRAGTVASNTSMLKALMVYSGMRKDQQAKGVSARDAHQNAISASLARLTEVS